MRLLKNDYDNADLAIVSILLIGIALIVTGHTDAGVISACVAGIAGIAKPSKEGKQ